jgi:hypothetical protein
MLNRGYGFTTAPTVTFSTAPANGQTATGVAEMIGGIVDICGPDPDKLRVQAVNITNSGFGYTTPPSVIFNGGGGSGVEALASLGNGVLNSINISDGGSGYVGIVTVSFVGISSQPAVARAVVKNGSIESIQLVNSGLGYTTAPIVTISDPVFVGYGTYIYNEVVAGSASSITARVKSWDMPSGILQLSNPTGTFGQGETIIGQESGATYKIEIPSYGDNIEDTYADNIDIEEESKNIIDYTIKNPFGEF